ncbi:MAG: hypothetical protein KBG20_17935 [Caldilineaceae bacterium]|nr:hypothetical protein [Caldilineaceae bacterium]MBP8109629.1 hypothetical protein [Caldilineaceae bacterium]MBP8122018.1 hypothetical protein [Caldilineaceae bacterium]MBP9074191.1 hypothetical protein [Caldilineaceae bacterium]
MSKTSIYPSYAECVTLVLREADSPVSMDALLAAVESMRPVTKSARGAVYQAIGKLHQAVPVSEGHFGWLSNLLRGNTFRHTLSKTELRRGVIYLDEMLHTVLAPDFFQTQRMDLRPVQLTLNGESAPLSIPITIDRKVWALKFGESLAKWVDAAGGQPQDDVMIQVDDAEAGRFTLRLQPKEMRDAQAMDLRNLAVAIVAEEILRLDRKLRTFMPVWDLVALLIGQGLFQDPIPPDELHLIMARYSTLRYHQGQGYALPDTYNSFNLRGAPDERARAPFDPFLEPDPSLVFGQEYGYDDNSGMDNVSLWDDEDLADEADLLDPDDLENLPCPDYQAYLDVYETLDFDDTPLGHDEYHLLEAELEGLVSLEYEFGYLMPDQEARKIQLGERLFIDPDSMYDNFGDDMDTSDMDGPPFWEN